MSSDMVVSGNSAYLTDYVSGSAFQNLLQLSQTGTGISIALGVYGQSGATLDRSNLIAMFDGEAETQGIAPILRLPLASMPTLTSPISGSITFRMTSGMDDQRGSGETQVAITIDVSISSASSGVEINAVAGEYEATIANDSNSFPVPITFLESDSVAEVVEEEGSNFLDLKFFSFLPKLDVYSPLLSSLGLEGNYHLQMEMDWPLQDGLDTTISSIAVLLPIAESGNHAPQLTIADQQMTEEIPVIVTLSATDLEQNDISYELLSGGSVDTVSAQIIGDQLTLIPDLDYYTDQSLQFEIKATDTLGASSIEQFSVTVENVLEPEDAYQGTVGYWGNTEKLVSPVYDVDGAYVKTVTDADSDAIELDDVLVTLKYYLGITQLDGYAEEAADFNGNGSVGLDDVLGTLKSYLGISSTSWYFENASTEGVDVVGVLRGDVNGSWESEI